MPWNLLLDWIRRKYPRAEAGENESGWPEARHCGDPGAEYAALTRGVALLVSPLWAPIFLEGVDAVAYLHRRLSQSIKTLPLGGGAHALQLGGDGRMQSDLLVYRGEDALFALSENRFAAADADLSEKYTLADDVTVSRQWESEIMVSLAGPAAAEIILSLLDMKIDPQHFQQNRWAALFTVTLRGLPSRIFSDGRWPIPFFHLSIPGMAAEQLLRALDETCRAAGGQAAGWLAGELLRVESGIPRFGLDTNERTIPLEAGLTDAISFDKGCYPGQEFIARINNLGHPARRLVRLSLDAEHEPGCDAKLFVDGREAGYLTSSITWPGLGRTEGLGYLQWNDREAKEVEIDSANQRIKVLVKQI